MVVAVTDGRLDGSAELAEVFGAWERIFQGQTDLTSEQIDSLWHVYLQIHENLGQRIQLLEASQVE